MTPALKKALAEVERLRTENEAVKREGIQERSRFVQLTQEVTRLVVQNRELLEIHRADVELILKLKRRK